MLPVQSLILTIDADLGARLAAASEQTGLAPADLVLRALASHLDGIVAYDRVTYELNLVKDGLATLAGLVGEVLAEPDAEAVGAICRYKAPCGSDPSASR